MNEPLKAYLMPLYQSHKKVRALEIKAFERDAVGPGMWLHFADERYPAVSIDSSLIARYKPVSGDFFVQYEDGYQSISPRKAFLEGYSIVGDEAEEKVVAGEERMSPKLPPGTNISADALIVDLHGVAWWVRPGTMRLVRAD